MEYIKEMSDDLIGKKITCEIRGMVVSDARIQKEDDKYYICQNVNSGSNCKDKLGYEYSWSLLDGSEYNLKKHNVAKLMLHPDEVLTRELPIFN